MSCVEPSRRAGPARAAIFCMWLCGGLAGAAAAQSPAPDTPVNPFRSASGETDPAAVAAGRKTFNGTCAACHGAEASGGNGPALNTGRFAHGENDDDLFRTIEGGIASGGMPAFAALPPNDIWQLVTYLKSLSAGGGGVVGPYGDEAAARRGRELFYGSAGCSACHEVDGAGLALSADLSAVGAKGLGAIRAGLAHPIARAPFMVELTRADGSTLRGVVLSEDGFDLVLRGMDGDILRVARRDLREAATRRERLQPTPGVPDAAATESLLAYLSRQTARAVNGAIAASSPGTLTAARLAAAPAEPQNWPTYWGDYRGRHFSDLTQMDTANVGRLQAKWAAQLPGASMLQATPIVVDGIMYVAGSPGEVHALDARTGLQIWKFSRRQDAVNPYQINPFNRGVAVLDGRVFVGTLDDWLIAIDARTGRELWERRIADTLEGYTMTGAPLALADRIVVGVGCGEYGVRGFLESYDPATGKRLWRVETIPGPGEPGHDTWPGDSWKRGGGGTWLTGSYDPDLRLLYWAVGNPAPYNNWKVREGDNLHTDSVLALNPDTGAIVWSYQFTPHDSHDWDSAQDLVLADRIVDGRPRKLLMHADRNGFFYVLDRTNGRFLFAKAFVRQTWNGGFDRRGRPSVLPGSLATREGQPVFPTTSATNFQAPSYDAQQGRFYLAYRDAEGFAAYGDADFERGKLYTAPSREPRPAASVPPAFGIRALDAATGETLWSFPLTRFTPQAGVLATRGGLVFGATADGTLLALDAHDGAPLWHYRTGGLIISSPISYSVDGQQFLALAAGNVVYGFALPDTR